MNQLLENNLFMMNKLFRTIELCIKQRLFVTLCQIQNYSLFLHLLCSTLDIRVHFVGVSLSDKVCCTVSFFSVASLESINCLKLKNKTSRYSLPMVFITLFINEQNHHLHPLSKIKLIIASKATPLHAGVHW